MYRKLIVGVIALISLVAAPLSAQGGRGRMAMPPGGGNRANLEQEFKDRLASVVKERLALSDEQMLRLTEVNQKYDRLRFNLLLRDRVNRMGLRKQLLESASPEEERVSQLLAETQRIARERLELQESEQADLSKFLSAVQRARYLGLQEQIRQRVEQFRGRPPFMSDSAAGPPGRGRRRPPG